MKLKQLKFDVCIIGSGPAGFSAAMRSYDFDNHICIIEGKRIGGAGILNGALSSKTMWELASNYSTAKRTDRGYRASGISVDYNGVMDCIYQSAREKEYQILSQIETFAKKPNSTRSLTLIRGWAKFQSNKKIIVQQKNGEVIEIVAGNFIIAAGSIPRIHPLLAVDGDRIITSDNISSLKRFPRRILIVGAGIVGCEFATIFANFGESEVHLLDSQCKVIPFEDDDVSDYVNEKLTKIGVKMHHEATLRNIRREENHIDVILDHRDGHSKVIAVDVILISIGRVPATSNLGLENTDIQIGDRGLLKTDNQCQVSKNIYAVGDISGGMALVNIAEMEGRFAAKAIENRIRFPLNYDNISTIMFFTPEISSIGMNEKECQAKNISYKAVFYHHSLITRAVAMRETDGFFKIIVTDEENPLILGMRAAGPQAAASVVYLATIVNHKQRLNDIMKTVHPHPSISEGIQEALRALDGKSIWKRQVFPSKIKFKIWKAK